MTIDPVEYKKLMDEFEYLSYFYQHADFGPAHSDVVAIINSEFEDETGNLVPEGYRNV